MSRLWVLREVRLGFDAVVCVQKYDPWITEAYNTSTRSSFALRIVQEQNGSTSLSPSGSIQGAQIAGTRYLNATGKDFVFSMVHDGSVDRFGETNIYQGRPNPSRAANNVKLTIMYILCIYVLGITIGSPSTPPPSFPHGADSYGGRRLQP